MSTPISHDVSPARTIVLHPAVYGSSTGRTPGVELEEIVSLSGAIDVEIIGSSIVQIKAITPNLFIGGGKVQELADAVEEERLELLIINAQLTPIQQRNLERAVGVKVIDRTALILEIFGARAATREGMLQVELASMTYQKSRLVRSWTHLERQRGGGGFMGGPGERQIESDRRYIDERIRVIKQQLQKVVQTRSLHRKQRKKVPYPIVALVGYTNAGKSTLFNRMTGADVLAKDALFATLDPTLRKLTLPSGREIMLSDTVGFISNLPTELVAAFRATLEEVVEADLLLHVRDASSSDSSAQQQDVETTLSSLVHWHEVSENSTNMEKNSTPLLVVHNKSDKMRDSNIMPKSSISVSALHGDGIERLIAEIDGYFASLEKEYSITLSPERGKARAWLHTYGEILQESSDEHGITTLEVRLPASRYAQFERLFG